MRHLIIVGIAALVGTLAAPAAAQQTCPCTTVSTCDGDCGGSECCQFGCTDFGSDPFNCGSCGNDCGLSADCANGVCVCAAGSVRSCYTGPFGTDGVGRCRAGTQTCGNGNSFGPCSDITPAAETCNDVDDDCDGRVDNVAGGSAPLTQSCYSGPPGTSGTPPCRPGTQVCQQGAFGACLGQTVPTPSERCGLPPDPVDAGSDPADAGQPPSDGGSEPPPDDAGKPAPDAGEPPPDAGEPPPDDAGEPDDGPCVSAACYDGPTGTAGLGACRDGAVDCATGSCEGQVLPGAPRCDGLDHDCDGLADTACTSGVCENGVCVPNACGGELSVLCPTGYECISSTCEAIACAGAGACPAGEICVEDVCTRPCEGRCAAGEACFADRCVDDDCSSFGCLTGYACIDGTCVVDPCTGVACADGELCRDGVCAPSCASVTCPEGQRCGADAECEQDPCAGVACGAGDLCIDGACVNDPCTAVVCPPAQVCRAGACVEDPCDGVSCPGQSSCVDGQCYLPSNPPRPPDPPDLPGVAGPGAPGCGCDSGVQGAPAVLGLALLTIRRRRKHA